MKLFRELPDNVTPIALCIGNFDGVHLGHQALMARTLDEARSSGLTPAVMTFHPHPREVFDFANAPARLSSTREKAEAIALAGIQHLYVPRFNTAFARQSPAAFLDVLQHTLKVRWLLVGKDFRFGARRAGDVGLMRAEANIRNMRVECLGDVRVHGERVSSTAIRSRLCAGDLTGARDLLGRPYAISGRVVHGKKLGRTLGFPTANVSLAGRKPALSGVFAVRCRGIRGLEGVANGVANLGTNPAVQVDGRPTLEVFLFDFSRDLYGQRLEVEFIAKLRDETCFDSLDALTAQIRKDCDHARALL
ncbi:MAG: bifunctional riboflavin kinase/FAD synthetase [Betaproteobacteria bacterium]|nr:bifunctional riboflavin kinase/FAD synthetase [Betaproteobacteria bacterium]